MRKGLSSVWDLLDNFTAWLRSAMAYVWTNNIPDFQKNVVIWVQSNAGFSEGKPHTTMN